MRLAAVLAVLALFHAATAHADAPAAIPLHGRLTDADGVAIDGEVTIVFAIYDTLFDGTPIFTEEQLVDVTAGEFLVFLGAESPFDLAVFRNETALYVGVTVGSDPEMEPRLPLGTVPYAGFAQYAADASLLDGLDSSGFAAASHSHAFGDLADVPAGLADGDDNTTYSAGTGLGLVGTTFGVDPATVQSRVTGTCDSGEAIREVLSDGAVVCEAMPTGTTYTEGNGIDIAAGVMSIDPSYVQRRVTGTCTVGQTIASIAADGSVTCTALGGVPLGDSVMYLRRWSGAGVSPSCPAGWTEADYSFERTAGPADNYVRTCFREDLGCQVLYLRRWSGAGDSPACPTGWTQADYSFERTAGPADNYVRTCFRCR